MRYTITHRGVPVGEVELDFDDDELTAADVRPLAGYAALRPVVRAATDALRNHGFLGPAVDPASAAAGEGALGRHAARGRTRELRAARGAHGPRGPAVDPASAAAGEGALGRNAALGRTLELRDARGALVPADFVDLAEWPDRGVTAWVRVRDAAAAVPARELPPRGAAPERSRPEA